MQWLGLLAQAILSVVLVVLSTPPISLVPLLYVCLIPVFVVLRKESLSLGKKLFFSVFHSWALGVSVHYWVFYPAVEFGGYSTTVGVILTLVFGLFSNIEFAVAGCLAALCSKRYPFAVVSVYGLVVFVLSKVEGLKIFPWTLAAPQLGFEWLAPGFFVFGTGGMLCFVFFLNVVFETGWVFFSRKRTQDILRLCRDLSLVLVLGGVLVGVRGWLGSKQQDDVLLHRFVLVQANIGNVMKLSAERGMLGSIERIVSTYKNLTDAALRRLGSFNTPTTVVWPETAYPIAFQSEDDTLSKVVDNRFVSWMKEHSAVQFFFGAYGYDSVKGGLQNTLIWAKKGALRERYAKRRLLAFGEFLPLRSWLPDAVVRLWPFEDFRPGQTWDVWEMDDGARVLPTVCYEILFSDVTRTAFEQDANLVLNITNDSWFVTKRAKALHLLMARERSAVTGLPTLRMTNTGVTAWIDENGQVESILPANRTVTQHWKKTFAKHRSGIRKHWFVIQSVVGWVLVLMFFVYAFKLRKRVSIHRSKE